MAQQARSQLGGGTMGAVPVPVSVADSGAPGDPDLGGGAGLGGWQDFARAWGSSQDQDQAVAADQVAAPARVMSDAVLQNRAYFTPTLCAYVCGLVMAFAANSITSMGQPALLYLVPCTFTAIMMTAVSRQEVERLWLFNVGGMGVGRATRKRGLTPVCATAMCVDVHAKSATAMLLTHMTVNATMADRQPPMTNQATTHD